MFCCFRLLGIWVIVHSWLLPILGVCAAETTEDLTSAAMITLNHAVHFRGIDGEDVLAKPGIYRVESEDHLIGLIPESGAASLIIEGSLGKHEESVTSSTVVGVLIDQDEFYLGVLTPSGQAIETLGSRSGTQRRGTGPVAANIQARALRSAPDKVPPSGVVTSPKAGAIIKDIVQIIVQAMDNIGVQDVQILVDGSSSFCSLEKNAPYTCNWDTHKVKEGSHSIAALIRDKSSNRFTTTMVPIVVQNAHGSMPSAAARQLSGQIMTPSAAATVKGVVKIEVQGRSASGIRDVQILIDGNPSLCPLEKVSPYSCDWDTKKVSEGSHTLTAVIHDTTNQASMTPSVPVTVKNTDAGQSPSPSQSSAPIAGKAVPQGQLIVRYKDTATPQSILGFMGKSQAQARASVRSSFTKADLLSFPAGMSLALKVQELKQDPSVAYVEPNYPLKINQVAPNDPSFVNNLLWGLGAIQAPRAWSKTTGSQNVIVAVLDTGVDYNHRDLAANMWRNQGEVPGDGVDNERDAIVDDVFGVSSVNWFSDPANRGNPYPNFGDNHGTHVAGTIAAVGNNSTDLVGVGWQTRIMAVKVMANCNPVCAAGGLFELTGGIQYAADHGAHIINFSGSICPSCYDNPFSTFNPSQFLDEHIKYAQSKGVLIVAAAGNDGSNNDVNPVFPASSGWPNVMAVAATDKSDTLASFSNYGLKGVHLAAPGVDIRSTLPGNQVGHMNGTSMAAPHVAGAAALVKAVHPDWGYALIKEMILRSVDKVPALSGKVLTGGRLNVASAVGLGRLLSLNGEKCTTDGDCLQGVCYPFYPYANAYCKSKAMNCSLDGGRDGAPYGARLTVNGSVYTCSPPDGSGYSVWLPPGRANGVACSNDANCQSNVCGSYIDGATYCTANAMTCATPNSSGTAIGGLTGKLINPGLSGHTSDYRCEQVAGGGRARWSAKIGSKPNGQESLQFGKDCQTNFSGQYADGKHYCMAIDKHCSLPGSDGVYGNTNPPNCTVVNGQNYKCLRYGGWQQLACTP